MISEMVIEATDLSVTFSRNGTTTEALAECDLGVPREGKAAIIGPSGCGKSTLLRVLAGLLLPTAGDVRVTGNSPAEARRGRRVMLVSQNSTLLPWRTLRRNVELAQEIAGIPRRDRRAASDQAIRQVGLEGFEEHHPNQLSGGMRQRACIARALAMTPDVLLLDEPFGALDEITREQLNYELLKTLEVSRSTMLLVTHNIAEAILLSDVVFIMSPRPGRIVGRIPVPFGHPRQKDVREEAAFLGLETDIRRRLQSAISPQPMH